MRRRAWIAAVVLVAACDQVAVGTEPVTQDKVPTTAEIAYARAKLPRLAVAVPDKTGYRRTRDFGPAWSVDVDRNGCGTRDDILKRDLGKPQLRGRCTVVAGTLDDPYTGSTVVFTKADADEVQIDHVVPLAAAWSLGAKRWPQQQRERFANDPLNLLATTKKANLGKGDDTPSEWLPRQQFRCAYAVRYVQVVATYRLALKQADRATLAGALRACPA